MGASAIAKLGLKVYMEVRMEPTVNLGAEMSAKIGMGAMVKVIDANYGKGGGKESS